MKMNKEVEKYTEKQKSPQREICHKLRTIILKTFPDIQEEMKMGVPWYEGKYYIVALKDHINLGFSLKGLSKEEIELFEGGGKTIYHAGDTDFIPEMTNSLVRFIFEKKGPIVKSSLISSRLGVE